MKINCINNLITYRKKSIENMFSEDINDINDISYDIGINCYYEYDGEYGDDSVSYKLSIIMKFNGNEIELFVYTPSYGLGFTQDDMIQKIQLCKINQQNIDLKILEKYDKYNYFIKSWDDENNKNGKEVVYGFNKEIFNINDISLHKIKLNEKYKDIDTNAEEIIYNLFYKKNFLGLFGLRNKFKKYISEFLKQESEKYKSIICEKLNITN